MEPAGSDEPRGGMRSADVWKVIVGAAVASAVSTALVMTLLGDEHDDASRKAVSTTAASLPAPSASEPESVTAPARPRDNDTGATQTLEMGAGRGGEIDPGQEDGALAALVVADALAPEQQEGGAAEPTASEEEPEPDADAGAPPATASADAGLMRGYGGSNPYAPSMSAGAGPFMTAAPPWAASAFTSDPNAGAGAFLTTPSSPLLASGYTSNPNAGAGAFTTEWPSLYTLSPLAPILVLSPPPPDEEPAPPP